MKKHVHIKSVGETELCDLYWNYTPYLEPYLEPRVKVYLWDIMASYTRRQMEHMAHEMITAGLDE